MRILYVTAYTTRDRLIINAIYQALEGFCT